MSNIARCFEELRFYQLARELTNEIYRLTKDDRFARDYGLINQIRRAGISIMSNIAEGFERGSKTEFIQFLYISKGSCGEVRAQLQIACDQGYLSEDKFKKLTEHAKQVSRMISNFLAHLQKTEYKGEKVERKKRLKNS